MSARNSTEPRVDLDEILHSDDITDSRVKAWFRQGDWDEERYLVSAIARHLLTEDQLVRMQRAGLDIPMMLNGRYGEDKGEVVSTIYHEWNTKLGFYSFGSDGRRQGEPYPPAPSEWTDEQIDNILRQAEMADYVEVKTSGCADSESWGDSVSFRWFRDRSGLEVILDNPYEGDLTECQIDISDLRKMRIDGNTLVIMANDGSEDDDGVLIEEDKFEIGITLMRKVPMNITPPTDV